MSVGTARQDGKADDIHYGRPVDRTLWVQSLDRHHEIFGRAPFLATADRGFRRPRTNGEAIKRGVRRVVLLHPGRKTAGRSAYERQPWFRRGRRWRVGSQGRISVLTRRHGLTRCRYHRRDRMHRWVGLGVSADNLVTIARFAGRAAAA